METINLEWGGTNQLTRVSFFFCFPIYAGGLGLTGFVVVVVPIYAGPSVL